MTGTAPFAARFPRCDHCEGRGRLLTAQTVKRADILKRTSARSIGKVIMLGFLNFTRRERSGRVRAHRDFPPRPIAEDPPE